MNQETENYLRHLRGQLNDLRSARSALDRIQEENNELENNLFVLRQERSETESNKEDNIKAHNRVLEELKSENSRTLASLRERQTQIDSINQQLQSKQQELEQLNAQNLTQQWKLETNERGYSSLKDQIHTLTTQKANIEAESFQILDMISEVKEHIGRATSKISERRSRVIQKEKSILILERRREDLLQTLESRRQVLRTLTFKSDRNEQEIQKARESLDCHARVIKELKDRTSCLNREISGLEEKLSTDIREGNEFEG